MSERDDLVGKDEPTDRVEKLWALAERLTGKDRDLVADAADELEQLRAETGAIDMILGRSANDRRERIVVLKAKLAKAR